MAIHCAGLSRDVYIALWRGLFPGHNFFCFSLLNHSVLPIAKSQCLPFLPHSRSIASLLPMPWCQLDQTRVHNLQVLLLRSRASLLPRTHSPPTALILLQANKPLAADPRALIKRRTPARYHPPNNHNSPLSPPDGSLLHTLTTASITSQSGPRQFDCQSA